MAQIQVKARDGASLHGKPREYLCCHDEDFSRYFETVSNAILSISNCAVYYYKPGQAPENAEEHRLDLSLMRLFVMPVTAKLLWGGNRALDTEFPFAMERLCLWKQTRMI